MNDERSEIGGELAKRLLNPNEATFEELYSYARELRDTGVKQEHLYHQFHSLLAQTNDMPLQHEALLEVLDCICSGGWGGTRSLFPESLGEK